MIARETTGGCCTRNFVRPRFVLLLNVLLLGPRACGCGHQVSDFQHPSFPLRAYFIPDSAGGLGVIGGVGYTPKFLREQIKRLKTDLNDPKAPFGVDLLIPQVGEGARKTNYDYTNGALPELIDVIIEEGARLFVCAVGQSWIC